METPGDRLPYPNINEFLSHDDNGKPLALLKPTAAALFGNALLAWHVEQYIIRTKLVLLNMSKTQEKAVEMALQWVPVEWLENEEERKISPHHWDLRQFNVRNSSVMDQVIYGWWKDCKRYPEMKRHNMVLQSKNKGVRVAKEYILNECANHISVLDRFDKVNKSKCFLFGGTAYEVEHLTSTYAHIGAFENQPEVGLLTDTDEIADDETYKKNLPELMAYMKRLWPKYEKKPEDKQPSRHGNYAVDVWLMQHVKAFVPCGMREVTFCSGKGKNGKSGLLKMFKEALTNSKNEALSPAVMVPGDVFADERGSGSAENKQKGDRSDLRGRRVVYSTEGTSGRADADFIKPMAAGEMCRGGGNYRDNEGLYLHCCCFIASNNPPRFYEDTEGIDRRCVVIRFEVKFKKDTPGKMDDMELEAFSTRMASTIRRLIRDEIIYWVEDHACNFPEELPGEMEQDRKDIINAGKDPVKVALEEFFEVGDTKDKILLGGGTQTGGWMVNKKGFYGVGLVVRLICEEQGLTLKNYKNPKIKAMMEKLGAELYAGNKKVYRNITPTKALREFLRTHTGSDSTIDFLYDHKGFKNADDEAELPPEMTDAEDHNF